MTKKEFIKILKKKYYSYEIEGDKIVIGGDVVNLRSLTTIPSGVEFKNGGSVDLRKLTTIPSGVEFKNGGFVDLGSLTTIPSGVEFNNKGDVFLKNINTRDSIICKVSGVDPKRMMALIINKIHEND